MIDRRSFLTTGTLLGLSSFFLVDNLYSRAIRENAFVSQQSSDKDLGNVPSLNERYFISHRGVHLKSSIAGENSLESISLAKRAGFACVEFDVGLSKDGALFVMHDKTLNRTVLRADGTELSSPVSLDSKTTKELKNDFKLKASEERKQTVIPTYQGFLKECKRLRILPFIELKLHDMSNELYIEVVRIADEIMGRGNYVITSNNQANKKIRSLGILHAPVMGILYQTTFDKIESLGNAIMAVSASRFQPDEFKRIIRKCNTLGIATESHSDNFQRFQLIDETGIDYVSTDVIAPDLKAGTLISYNSSEKSFDEFDHTGKVKNGILRMENDDSLQLFFGDERLYFGAIFLEITYKGNGEIQLMNQRFSIESKERHNVRYQLMLYDSAPRFEIKADKYFEIIQLIVKVVQY